MYVLDASAVLAVLLDERGSEAVIPHLRGGEITIVNWCEILTKSAAEGGDLDEVQRILATYGLRVRAFTEAHAIKTARLRPLTRHRGLGLGDRACLAHGKLTNQPVLTGETKWLGLDVEVEIVLFR